MRTFYKGPLGEHGTGHDGPDAPSIMNDADLAEAGRHRVDAEPRAAITAGCAWIGFALAISMRQYGAFTASGQHTLPERREAR